jgi:hypothetical protein
MKPRKAQVLAAAVPLLALAAVGFPARPVLADDFECVGTAPPGVVFENLIVPSGAVCELAGHTIRGNVKVLPGGSLTAQGITVGGNLQADGHDSVLIAASSVLNGSVQATNGTGLSTSLIGLRVGGDVELTDNDHAFVFASGNTVEGNVKIEKNETGFYNLIANAIDGDLQFFRNAGFSLIDGSAIEGNLQFFANVGGGQISGNVINGNLQCKENVPPPLSGPNAVGGNAEEQCPADAQVTPGL